MERLQPLNFRNQQSVIRSKSAVENLSTMNIVVLFR